MGGDSMQATAQINSKSYTNTLANLFFKFFALNFNNRPSLKKYLKGDDGWLNFTFGIKTESGSMEQAMQALTESLKHMATNLSINDLLSLVIPVFTGMEDMDTRGFPDEGDYHYEHQETLKSMVVFKQDITTQKLHDYIYGNDAK